MSEVCVVQVQLLTKLQENSLRPSKERDCKVHAKSTTLLIYYITSIFQGILLGFKQFLLLFIKTGFINIYNTLINLYIWEVSSLSYLLFDFSPVKRHEKTNSLDREHEIICFMLCNTFFHKNTVGESKTPLLLQKNESAKSDVLKVLFPEIGKITAYKYEQPIYTKALTINFLSTASVIYFCRFQIACRFYNNKSTFT